MATHITRLPSTVHNNDTFRAFFSGTMQAIEACGWVNTNAVGSINTGSATWDTTGAYVVYQSNDSFTTETPIFLRIRMNVNFFRLRIESSIGWFHNGSGSLRGSTEARQMYLAPVNTIAISGTLDNLYASGDGSYLNLAFSPFDKRDDDRGFLLSVSRTNDITGSYTDTGAYFMSMQNVVTTANWFSVIRFQQNGLRPVVYELDDSNYTPFFFPDSAIGDTQPASYFWVGRSMASLVNPTLRDILPPKHLVYIKRKGVDAFIDLQNIRVYNTNYTYLNLGRFFSFNPVMRSDEGSLLMQWE